MNKYLIIFLLSVAPIFSIQAQERTDSLNYLIQNFQFRKALQLIDNQEETKQNKYQKAMCYKALGENNLSMRILKELDEDYPDDVLIKTELANSYERASRWKESSDTYASLMSLDSTNLYFGIRKSEAEMSRRNYKQAIIDLQSVVKQDSLPNAIKLLGKSYEATNNLDSAAYYFNLAVSIDSLDSFSASNLVNIALKKKEYKKALEYTQLFLKHTPDDKTLNMLQGYSFYALEDYDNASTILETCYLLGDSSLTVNRSLGISYFHKGDNECSYKYLSKAYEQDSTHYVVKYNLAISSKEVGEYDQAIDLHNKLLINLIPNETQLYLNYFHLGESSFKAKNYDTAVDAYIKALTHADTNQRLSVLSPLAELFETKLPPSIRNTETAANYYRQYRSGFNGLVAYLKSEDETSSSVIAEYEAQLKELDIHIAKLEAQIEKHNKENPPLTQDDFMFVVGNTIKDTPPTEDERKNVASSIFIPNFDNVPEKYKHWVDEAKKRKKRSIYVFEMKQEEN